LAGSAPPHLSHHWLRRPIDTFWAFMFAIQARAVRSSRFVEVPIEQRLRRPGPNTKVV